MKLSFENVTIFNIIIIIIIYYVKGNRIPFSVQKQVYIKGLHIRVERKNQNTVTVF